MMALYTVVVVDDEKWSIMDLLNSVAWDARGFRIAGFFDHSREALSRITELAPDVVFTDIRMPRLDGIGLMRAVREAGIGSEFVVISAFADFESARKAIEIGVADYCMKPVNPEALAALLEKLKARLDAKRGAAETVPDVPALLPANLGRVVAHLRDHYTEDLRLEGVAAAFNMNKNYLCQLFKKHLGTTFSHYLASLRVNRAKEHLTRSDLSIEGIAAKVGYEDYFYFCKVFKKVEGVAPGRYRRGSRTAYAEPGSTDTAGAS